MKKIMMKCICILAVGLLCFCIYQVSSSVPLESTGTGDWILALHPIRIHDKVFESNYYADWLDYIYEGALPEWTSFKDIREIPRKTDIGSFLLVDDEHYSFCVRTGAELYLLKQFDRDEDIKQITNDMQQEYEKFYKNRV